MSERLSASCGAGPSRVLGALVVGALVWLAHAAGCANSGTQGGRDAGRRDAAARCEAGQTCAGRCVDTAVDVEHCGGCGRTCVVPHAVAACVEGECRVGTCEAGHLDCNDSADDGCEQAVSCEEGASCTTECGTIGARRCADACASVCAPPAESCNLIDDDCDGACESGLPGCRVAVHRSNGPSGHFYTTNRTEAACCGMTVERHDYFYLSNLAVDGTQPFIRCIASDGHHLYTTDTACEGAGYEGQMGHIARSALCGAVPLYRLYLARSGDHFYTTSASERASAMASGYEDRGVLGYVWGAP